MKLNNKRTILVGLAFLSICAFWQMYDNIVPLILTRSSAIPICAPSRPSSARMCA